MFTVNIQKADSKKEIFHLILNEKYTIRDMYIPGNVNCMMATIIIGGHELKHVEITLPNVFQNDTDYEINNFVILYTDKIKWAISEAIMRRVSVLFPNVENSSVHI